LGRFIVSKVKLLSCMAIMVLAMGIIGTGCDTNSDNNDQALLLQTYEVPAEYALEVSTVIRDLLILSGKDVARIGEVRIGPGDMITVAAPASIHRGIEKLIDNIVKAKPEPPLLVSLTYWIVVGSPAEKSVWPPQLSEIEPALQAISASEGPMSFDLHERLHLRSLSGESASLRGGMTTVRQTATAREDSVLGDIAIQSAGMDQNVNTKIQIGFDDVLVLGQSGCPQWQVASGGQKTKCGPGSNVFYIV
jgi:hypothetical protein